MITDCGSWSCVLLQTWCHFSRFRLDYVKAVSVELSLFEIPWVASILLVNFRKLEILQFCKFPFPGHRLHQTQQFGILFNNIFWGSVYACSAYTFLWKPGDARDYLQVCRVQCKRCLSFRNVRVHRHDSSASLSTVCALFIPPLAFILAHCCFKCQ